MGILTAIIPGWARILFLVTLVAGVWGHGYFKGLEHGRKVLNEYIVQVSLQAGKQIQQTEEIVSRQRKITNEKDIAFQSRLNTLRTYYAKRLRDKASANGSSTVPEVPNSSTSVNAIPPYDVLIGQCGETTLQLVFLQEWVKEQERESNANPP